MKAKQKDAILTISTVAVISGMIFTLDWIGENWGGTAAMIASMPLAFSFVLITLKMYLESLVGDEIEIG